MSGWLVGARISCVQKKQKKKTGHLDVALANKEGEEAPKPKFKAFAGGGGNSLGCVSHMPYRVPYTAPLRELPALIRVCQRPLHYTMRAELIGH